MRYGHPDTWSPDEHDCYDPANCEVCHRGHEDMKWSERVKACLICRDEFDELVASGEKCGVHPDSYCEAAEGAFPFFCEACDDEKNSAGAEPRSIPAGPNPAILPSPSL